MKKTSIFGRQFIAMVVLMCLIGLPAVTASSRAVANTEALTPYPANPPAQPRTSPRIDWQTLNSDQAARRRGHQLYDGLPLMFEANAGQADEQVKFIARDNAHTLLLLPNEAVMTFGQGREPATASPAASQPAPATRLRMKLAGGNPDARMLGEDARAGKTSYLVGNDPRHWRAGITNYGRVRYRNLYRGIDLLFYGNPQQLEYDFLVAPGANPRAITLEFDGAGRLRIAANGDLVLDTPAGEVRHQQPLVYQELNGIRQSVAGRYMIKGRGRIGFHIGAYDKSRPLIIDPVIIYSTCFGGTRAAFDQPSYVNVRDMALDAAGNTYIAGETAALDMPTTPGAFQNVNRTVGQHDNGNGNTDAFIAKFDPTGKLVYSTYLGGANVELAYGLGVDATGNAYLAGMTSSGDYPSTPGAFRSRCAGCAFKYPFEEFEVFVSKLDATGTRLVYSTFLGFTTFSRGAFTVDAAGNAIVAGGIQLPSLPVVNGFQPVHGSPGRRLPDGTWVKSPVLDGYLIKLKEDGSQILYSTYLGGSAGDAAKYVAVDGQGKIYVVGDTESRDFPTANGYQMTPGLKPGAQAATLTKIDPEKIGAESLLYSTYLGSGSTSVGFTIDRQGRAYILAMPVGERFSQATFPNTTELQPKKKFTRPILLKLDPSYTGEASFLSAILFAKSDTTSYTDPTDVAVDGSGNIYITGTTQNYDFLEVNNTQVGGAFITSTDKGKTFVSRQITTRNSLNFTGQITFVAADPKDPATAYAGNAEAGHLLYKTTDGGASWDEIDFGTQNSIPNTVAIDPENPSVIYAGTKYAPESVYKSRDGGKNWEAAGPPGLPGAEVHAIAIDPSNPYILYIGCSQSPGDSSVLKSWNGGLSWQATGRELAGVDVNALTIDPKDPSVIYAGTENGLYKSSDRGNTWAETDISSYVVSLAIDPQRPATIYAGLADDDIRIADIGGRGNPRRRITISSLGRLEGVVKSTDGGHTWKTINNGLGPLVPLAHDIAVDPRNPSVLYGAMFDGLYKSTDGGDHWAFSGSVYNMTKAVALSAPPPSGPSTLFIGTRITNKAFILKLNPEGTQVLYSSYIGGNGWYHSDGGTGIAADDAGNVYLAGITCSSNFPTRNAFQKAEDLNTESWANAGFMMKIDTLHNSPPSGTDPAPVPVVKITNVFVSGKNLMVAGENFSLGAVIMLDHVERPTVNDSQTPSTALMSKKTGKQVKPGRSVMIQVKNADGTLSQEYPYVRPAN